MGFFDLGLSDVVNAGVGLYSARSARKGQESANATNSALFEKQLAFQRETLQNRHQWEVEDLKKAGLNPILSAGGNPPAPAAPAAPTMQNTKAQSAAITAGIAKLMSEVKLNEAKTRTERTQQEVNRGTADRARGTVSFPGIYSGPASSALQWVRKTYNPRSVKGAGKALRNLIIRGTFADA